MKLSIRELIAFVAEQKKIFDIVRLVDVSMTIQYSITEGGTIKEEPYQCYAVWNKDRRCENCISAKAFAIEDKLTKFEFVDREIFFVVAVYAEIEGTAYVIEMVAKLNDEVLFSAYGKNDFTEAIETYNKKMYIDALTGAYNRRYYSEQLKKLNRFNGIAALDVDNLKEINDTFGHAAGDAVLKEVVRIAILHTRASDAVIRLGGDEFLLLFQDISKVALVERLERIRQIVSTVRIPENPDFPVSVSIGALYSDDVNIKIVDAVDKVLYKAKERKNTVVLKEI